MKTKCLCPNCYTPVTVTGLKSVGWVSCNRCGHVFKVSESVESRRQKSALPANSPHIGLRP